MTSDAAAWIYILASDRNGTLYVGVTTSLRHRIHQHKTGSVPGFTSTYGVTKLVYAEPYAEISQAIQRERNLKHWSRAWKLALIEKDNPAWVDLSGDLHLIE